MGWATAFKRLFLPLAVAAILSGCFPHETMYERHPEIRAEAEATIKPYLGLRMLVASSQGILVSPSANKFAGEGQYRKGGIRIDSLNGYVLSYAILHVTMDDGAAGYVFVDPYNMRDVFKDPHPNPSIEYPTFLSHLSPQEFAKKRELPTAGLGASRAEVRRSAWGAPDRIVKRETSKSSHETWYYPNGVILFFKDDVLVRIAE